MIYVISNLCIVYNDEVVCVFFIKLFYFYMSEIKLIFKKKNMFSLCFVFKREKVGVLKIFKYKV